MGYKSIELLLPDRVPDVKPAGLTCAMRRLRQHRATA